ncbi:MAG: hypothetical protein MHMPM18_002620 [Marteilia pararefringens]
MLLLPLVALTITSISADREDPPKETIYAFASLKISKKEYLDVLLGMNNKELRVACDCHKSKFEISCKDPKAAQDLSKTIDLAKVLNTGTSDMMEKEGLEKRDNVCPSVCSILKDNLEKLGLACMWW